MKFIVSVSALLVFAFFAFSIVNAEPIANINSNQALTADSAKVHKKVKVKKENIGIGPVKDVKLGPINKSLVKEGQNIFNSKCFACHKLNTRLVGPALVPIVKKTNPVYLMNYLLNTTEMQKKEPQLKKLIKKFNGVVMPDQYINKKQARAVLEYLRSNVKGK